MTRHLTMPDIVPGHPHVRFDRWNGRDVVIKSGDPDERAREALALSLLGDAVVSVVHLDARTGELIVERALPGDDLRPLARRDDDAATAVIAGLIQQMRQPSCASARVGAERSGLPDLGAALDPVRACDDPRLPPRLIDRAMGLAADLLQGGREIALHGDLQHRNVARRGVDDWVAIDPHGWRGDPTFESAAVLAAPESLLLGYDIADARGMPGAVLVRRTRRRIAILADACGDEPSRLWAWAFVGAVVAEARMIAMHDLVHGAPLALAEELLETHLV